MMTAKCCGPYVEQRLAGFVLKYDLPANARLIQKEVSRIRSGQSARKKSNDLPQWQQPADRPRSNELA